MQFPVPEMPFSNFLSRSYSFFRTWPNHLLQINQYWGQTLGSRDREMNRTSPWKFPSQEGGSLESKQVACCGVNEAGRLILDLREGSPELSGHWAEFWRMKTSSPEREGNISGIGNSSGMKRHSVWGLTDWDCWSIHFAERSRQGKTKPSESPFLPFLTACCSQLREAASPLAPLLSIYIWVSCLPQMSSSRADTKNIHLWTHST